MEDERDSFSQTRQCASACRKLDLVKTRQCVCPKLHCGMEGQRFNVYCNCYFLFYWKVSVLCILAFCKFLQVLRFARLASRFKIEENMTAAILLELDLYVSAVSMGEEVDFENIVNRYLRGDEPLFFNLSHYSLSFSFFIIEFPLHLVSRAYNSSLLCL
jgi:hypothetical protein